MRRFYPLPAVARDNQRHEHDTISALSLDEEHFYREVEEGCDITPEHVARPADLAVSRMQNASLSLSCSPNEGDVMMNMYTQGNAQFLRPACFARVCRKRPIPRNAMYEKIDKRKQASPLPQFFAAVAATVVAPGAYLNPSATAPSKDDADEEARSRRSQTGYGSSLA